MLTSFVLFIPACFLFFAVYLGFFSSVEVKEVQKSELLIVGLPHQGNYQKVGKRIITTQEYFSTRELPCVPAAVYHHDEEKVIKKLLKSLGGCITTKPVNDLPKEYEVIRFPKGQAVEAKVKAHPGIAKIKLFSSLRKYAKQKSISFNFPVVASFENKFITFHFY